MLSHMAAAAARGPDAGQGRTGGRWLLARCRVPARQGKARLPRRACMHRATQAHPSRFGHARTGHALNYWRHARRERSRAPAGSMIGARVRGAPRRVPSGSGCHVGVRVQLSQAGSGHGHSRFGSLARGVTAPCSLPCGNRFSRCIHRPPSIQIQDQDDDPPAGRSPSVPMDPSGARQQPRARHLRGLAVPGCPTAIWPCLNPVHTLATTVPPHHSRQGR